LSLLTDDENKQGRITGALLRLLIDEIVDELSRSGSGMRERVGSKNQVPAWTLSDLLPGHDVDVAVNVFGLNNDFRKSRVFKLAPPAFSSSR